MAGIAVKFSMSLELVKRVNRLYLTAVEVQPGQVLKIPCETKLDKSPESPPKRHTVPIPAKTKSARNPPEAKSSLNDFLKNIDKGIRSSKSRLDKFDSTVVERLESTFDAQNFA